MLLNEFENPPSLRSRQVAPTFDSGGVIEPNLCRAIPFFNVNVWPGSLVGEKIEPIVFDEQDGWHSRALVTHGERYNDQNLRAADGNF